MSSLCAMVARQCDELLSALSHAELGDQVRSVRRSLGEPLQVAVAGPAGSGKSTMVNALLGRRAARTDGSPVTRLIAYFRYGSPERVVVCPAGGAAVSSSAMSLTLRHVPVDPGVTASVVFELPANALRDTVIVDTPGSAPDPTGRSPRSPLGIDSRSATAVETADALLLLLPAGFDLPDPATLHMIRRLLSTWRCSAANTAMILTNADLVATDSGGRQDRSGAANTAYDPLLPAIGPAHILADQLWPLVADAVPVAGLWAETVRSASLTEQDAVSLVTLAASTGDNRATLLGSLEQFVTAPVDVTPYQRKRLLRMLGLSGVGACLHLIDQGWRGPAALAAEMERMSHIATAAGLLGQFGARRDVLKATSAIDKLSAAAVGAGEASMIRDAIEDLCLDPSMERLWTLSALQLLAGGDVLLPAELVHEVVAMATGIEPAARMRLPQHTTLPDMLRFANERARQWHILAHARPHLMAGQERVAGLMYRSYSALHVQLRGSFL